MRQDVIDAIRRAAAEEGIDPNYAMAVAQRESNFNPNAHASKTIHGVFQMTGGLRDKWGAGDSSDPYLQSKAWMRYMKGEVAPAMRNTMGRDPTYAELYLGHHFGPGRAARMASGAYDPSTPVDEIFTPYERSLNPHFDKAGTSGNLVASITNDIGRRTAKFAGGEDSSSGMQSASLDFSKFGTPIDLTSGEGGGGDGLDFSQFGTPADLGQGQELAAAT
jgi:Transglycosylase SLT domain